MPEVRYKAVKSVVPTFAGMITSRPLLACLKTQAKGDLNLAFAVDRGAVGVGDGAEAGGAIGAA